MDLTSADAARAANLAAALSLAAFFALLWLPLGQTPFLVANWMKLGAFCAPLIVGVALALRPGDLASPEAERQLLAVFLLALYMVHQVEEHWIDLTGQQYAFYTAANALLRALCGASLHRANPMSPAAIFVINTTLVWLVGALAILRARTHVFPLLALAAIMLVNGIAHILGAVLQLAYNPGLATAAALFLPAALHAYRRLHSQDQTLERQILASIGWAGACHALMIGGVLASAGYDLVPNWLFWAALFVMAALPSLLFRAAGGHSRQALCPADASAPR